jgi:hypothetical protein
MDSSENRTFSEYLMDINDILPMTLFTPEDLLLYMYKETSSQQNIEIEKALQEDWTLREKLQVLQESMVSLDSEVVSPRPDVVLNALNYARETMVEPA